MKKIPSLFFMTPDHKITREVNPLCQWVIDGEGVATAKLDGSACMVKDCRLYKRYDNSRRKGDERVQKTQPLDDWIHCEDTTDRGSYIYWVPVGTKDYYHQIAWGWGQGCFEDGTYELVGPEVQGNPHQFVYNALVRHGCLKLHVDPRDFDSLRHFMRETEYEGIVWHHPDGRMAKLTKKKFGYEWPR